MAGQPIGDMDAEYATTIADRAMRLMSQQSVPPTPTNFAVWFEYALGNSVPLRGFMMKNVREKDLKLFLDLSGEPPPATPDDMSLRIIVPAFMISELKRAFEIGFLLFLPFLIIDLVVASVLMAMGMMMLPPAVVSLPFKLIFFVLVDGWSLVAGSLVQSYGQ